MNISIKSKIPQNLLLIAKKITTAGGKAILVGGATRDLLLGKTLKDFDIEIYNISDLNALINILKQFGKVNEVGKSFAVLKFTTSEFECDFSFPRLENKISSGHKGFIITPKIDIDFKTAAERRDFTINSMGIDLNTEEFLDPFNGKIDLLIKKTLRHVGPKFTEDPLRVLRAVQFTARFNLTIAPETIELAKTCDLTELPKERLMEEIKKLLLLSEKPSIGLEYFPKLGISKIFPELTALIGIPEDPIWHPEGDVWKHTLLVVDEMAKLKTGNEKKDLVLMLAALTHDLGKANTTAFIDERWRSINHEEEGVEPTKTFLNRLTNETDLIEEVVTLVKDHLKPALLYKDSLKNKVKDSAIRRLALRVKIDDLLRVSAADHFGRKTEDALLKEFPHGEWLNKRASELEVKDTKPKPFLLGRDLIELGFKPGPDMGKILKECFELQLDGVLKTKNDALNYIKNKVKNNG